MTNYKVLVIEDEDLVREGIVLILQVNGMMFTLRIMAVRA
jgi:YesN/AraC family two-component response regulator